MRMRVIISVGSNFGFQAILIARLSDEAPHCTLYFSSIKTRKNSTHTHTRTTKTTTTTTTTATTTTETITQDFDT